MLNLILRNWLRPSSRQRARKRPAISPRARGGFRPLIDQLEDRRLLSVSPSDYGPVAVAADSVGAQVVARHVFYNNSKFDLGNPAPNAADDGAIASDKRAVLAGQ